MGDQKHALTKTAPDVYSLSTVRAPKALPKVRTVLFSVFFHPEGLLLKLNLTAMKKTALVLALCATGFFACNKEDEASKPTGSIRYTNTSGDVYNIYLDGGAYGQVRPNSSHLVPNITADSHTVRAVQANNFSQKPISKENRIQVVQSQETLFTFP
jgi:hypothetical protein